MTTRVVVVDDDDISRRGICSLLSEDPNIEVVASLDHDGGLAFADWSQADVVVVDAADDRRHDDQFPGVGVVDAIRRQPRREPVTVIVLTGHFFDDAVRRRMREAGADFLYHRTEFADAQKLRDAVLHPDRNRRGIPKELDPENVFRQGIDDWTKVNAAVDFLLAHAAPMIDGRTAGPRSRAWLRWRRDFNAKARLHPVNTDGTPPERDQRLPSIPQITRFLEWSTKTKNHPRSG